MSVTCCPLDSGDGDGPRVFDQSEPIAAKVHQCSECGLEIARGERYELAKGLWESWETFRTCLRCVEIRDHFACEGFIYTHVWSNIREHFFPDMRAGGPCLDGLSPTAKAFMFEQRLAWLETEAGRDWLERRVDSRLGDALNDLRAVDPARADSLEAQINAHADAKAHARHLAYQAERARLKQSHMVPVQQEESDGQ